MKNLHKSCKYFFQKSRFLIIKGLNIYESMNDDKISADDYGFFENQDDFARLPSIWVTEEVNIGAPRDPTNLPVDWVISRIYRCDALYICIKDCVISQNSFEILTESKKVLQCYFFNTRIVNESGNLPMENILCNLPNADLILWVHYFDLSDNGFYFRLQPCFVTSESITTLLALPWKNKCHTLTFFSIDKIFDGKLFAQFLKVKIHTNRGF